jgi:hypothetical protein
MKHPSPVYHLLHQEIKACAEHLLEMGQKQQKFTEKGGQQILNKMGELQQFATKMPSKEHYLPLCAWKNYLEQTVLCYNDEQKRVLSMRLSEAIALLNMQTKGVSFFKPIIIQSLTSQLLRLFWTNIKPGRPLFKKLIQIKKM